MLKTPFFALLSVLTAAILGAIGQFLFQYGSKSTKEGVLSFLTHPTILMGMTCYLAVMFFFTYAFKLGGTVRVLYPIYASTFIWAAFMAWGLDHDPVKPIHIAGMILLVIGIFLMTW